MKKPAAKSASVPKVKKEEKEKSKKDEKDKSKTPGKTKPEDMPTNASECTLDEKMKDAKNKTEAETDEFLKNLNSHERMALWKRFEMDRSGTSTNQTSVRKAFDSLKGAGSVAQKRKLLRAWLQGGMQQASLEVSLSFEHLVSDKQVDTWLPLHKAKEHYGPEELKARLAAGILAFRILCLCSVVAAFEWFASCNLRHPGVAQESQGQEVRGDQEGGGKPDPRGQHPEVPVGSCVGKDVRAAHPDACRCFL